MARTLNRLTDTWLKKATIKTGIYGDGGSLYLRVQGSSRSWLFIYQNGGKRREMGLGAYPDTSLASAREKAKAARDLRLNGIDPLADKHKIADVVPTFEEVAELWVKANEAHWSAGVAARYRSYLTGHLATLSPIAIDIVSTNDVVTALRPTWGTPTSQFARSMIERVIDYATVSGHRASTPNIARYRGHIQHLLPQGRASIRHHPAMDYADVPAFYQALPNTLAGRMLKLTILTACRSREIRELKGHEVQADRIVIGAERYKTRKQHSIPIDETCHALIAPCGNDDYVFPGKIEGRPISEHAFDDLIPDGATCHGFRTSFAVWGVEQGGFTDELMQRCLGHVVGSATSRAYQRSDFFEQRRAVHEAWHLFVTTRPTLTS
ncbi:tyrosine-type recombinase/integrase [Phyllobacterium chamaecytisi]|uniref:tyrosine-type recombinase/integrase n=1 Tax=Phyllobacterium chamaecytisi TaxID=2876082 RepID=UPI001CC9620B|nr:integrase arm-type DNA-binding domain-containing protein [Phyllobacterium sp. KW56]MBZ9602665.1 integrase arm-type DNA-binding domain-containing protein [Phyllobacterium sp. KW56]